MAVRGRKPGKVSAQGELQRRQAIVEAAFRVVARDTLTGTRMPAIAREAGVSQGTLHYYFDTKENLLLRVAEYVLAPIKVLGGVTSDIHVQRPPPGDPEAVVEALMEWLDLVLNQEQDATRVFFDFYVQAAAKSGALQDEMQSQLRRYRDAIKELLVGMAVSTRNADAASSLVLSIIEGAAMQISLDPRAFDSTAYLAYASRVIRELVPEVESLAD